MPIQLTPAQRRRLRHTTGRKPGPERSLLDELVHLANLGDRVAREALESGTGFMEAAGREALKDEPFARQNRADLARRREQQSRLRALEEFQRWMNT